MIKKYKKQMEKNQTTQVINLFNSGTYIDLQKVKLKAVEMIENQLERRKKK
jgi:uncharacterized Fe-S cluster-containing MiaB family protein